MPDPVSQAEWIDCVELSTSILRIARQLERVQLEAALEEGRAALHSLECQGTPVDPLLLQELFQLC